MLLLAYLSRPQPTPATLRELAMRRARRRRRIDAAIFYALITGYVLAGAAVGTVFVKAVVYFVSGLML